MREWLLAAAIVIPIVIGAIGLSYLIVDNILIPIAEARIK